MVVGETSMDQKYKPVINAEDNQNIILALFRIWNALETMNDRLAAGVKTYNPK
jgi:hypothetical protein